jgi:hypothetical protein
VPLLFSLTLVAAGSLPGDDPSPIPVAWPASRYQNLRDRCPFALATAVETSAEPQASFAANWFVSGIGRLDGQDFVIIKSRDLSKQFSLYGHEANDGVILSSIEWSEKVGKSAVVIKKGNEIAKLEFNEAEIQGPPQVTSSAGTPPGGLKPVGVPSIAGVKRAPTPHSQMQPGRSASQLSIAPGAIASPNPVSVTPQPAGSGSLGQGQIRSRVRILNAPQQP